jgi:iron complex transport system ATP-binding protein
LSKEPRALRVEDVHFSYDGKEAVAGVTLEIERGRYVSLIGPNGAGKTTLVRLLSGVLQPARGKVEILGRDARSMSRLEIARHVAVVPQESGIIFPFTAEEVVLMGRFPHLGPYGFEGEEDFAVAREAMRLTETRHLADRPIQELSGGERQRVIIARALAQEADILLLDEPTAFLDIKHQVEITALVRRLKTERDLTVVAASHDLNLAAAFSDSLVLLKDGKVFASGAPDRVVREDVLSQAYGTDVYVGEWEEGRFVAPRIKRIRREK